VRPTTFIGDVIFIEMKWLFNLKFLRYKEKAQIFLDWHLKEQNIDPTKPSARYQKVKLFEMGAIAPGNLVFVCIFVIGLVYLFDPRI
jgi:hypothetical protein